MTAPFQGDASLVSTGPKGFLTAQSRTRLTWRWMRYADGVEMVLPDGAYGMAPQTDIVMETDERGCMKFGVPNVRKC